MTKECIFNFNIADGHSFLNAIKILKAIPVPCLIIFREESITIQSNSGAGLLMSIKIDTLELLRYHLNMKLVNKPEINAHVIFINPTVLRDQIGPITKKEGIRMWQMQGSEKIHIRSSGNTNRGTIKTEDQEYQEFNTSDFKRCLRNPNCSISLYDFVASMKKLIKIKISKADITVGESFLKIKAISNSNCSEKDFFWTDDSDEDSEENEEEFSKTIHVKKNIINMFSHLSSLTNGGIIKVYAEEDTEVIRFITKVGYFGELCLFIYENDEDEN